MLAALREGLWLRSYDDIECVRRLADLAHGEHSAQDVCYWKVRLGLLRILTHILMKDSVDAGISKAV